MDIRALLVAAFVLVACCARQAPRAATAAEMPLEPTEAALRTLLTENPSGVKASTVCVALTHVGASDNRREYSDPPAAVVRSLAATYPGLQPISQCRLERARGIGRLHDDAGKQAMIFAVDESIRAAGDTLIFRGTYHCGGLCGGGGSLRVWRQADGAWKTHFTALWIS